MKLELQLPIHDIPYSVNRVTLDEPTKENILDALRVLKLVSTTYVEFTRGKVTTPTTPTIDTSLMLSENKQLKQFQEQGQDLMNRLKHKDPELFSEIMKEMEAEDVHDNEANARVDDKILDEPI